MSNPYLLQLILLILIAADALAFLLTLPYQDLEVRMPDTTQVKPRRHGVHFGGTLPGFSLLLFALFFIGFALLELTHFNLCSFLYYWFPGAQGMIPPHC
jgi:hypothetical protein